MAGKLSVHAAPRTDDGPCVRDGCVGRWVVDGLPFGERVDILESGGRWRILRLRCDLLEVDAREFPSPEAAFAALIEEYSGRL